MRNCNGASVISSFLFSSLVSCNRHGIMASDKDRTDFFIVVFIQADISWKSKTSNRNRQNEEGLRRNRERTSQKDVISFSS